MSSPVKRSACALSLLSVLAAWPAWAEVESSAQMGVVSVTLIDLRPFDGVDPSLAFVQPQSSVYAGINGPIIRQDVDGYYAPASAFLLSAPHGYGQAHSDANGFWADTRVWGGQGDQDSYAYGSAALVAGIVLGPWTGVVFSAPLKAYASTTVGFDPETIDYESAIGQGSIQVALLRSDGTYIYYAYEGASADFVRRGDSYFGETSRFIGSVRLAVDNRSGQDLAGNISASVWAGGSSLMTPIPEPGTAALWLAGVGLLAGWSRHCRRKGQGPRLPEARWWQSARLAPRQEHDAPPPDDAGEHRQARDQRAKLRAEASAGSSRSRQTR